jgi:hypothetical protein
MNFEAITNVCLQEFHSPVDTILHVTQELEFIDIVLRGHLNLGNVNPVDEFLAAGLDILFDVLCILVAKTIQINLRTAFTANQNCLIALRRTYPELFILALMVALTFDFLDFQLRLGILLLDESQELLRIIEILFFFTHLIFLLSFVLHSV